MGPGEQQGQQQRGHGQQEWQGQVMGAAGGHVGSSREGREGAREGRGGIVLRPGGRAEASSARVRLGDSRRTAGHSAKQIKKQILDTFDHFDCELFTV